MQPIKLDPVSTEVNEKITIDFNESWIRLRSHSQWGKKIILMIIYARNSNVKSKIGANVLKNLKRKMSTVDIKYDSTKNYKITNYSE